MVNSAPVQTFQNPNPVAVLSLAGTGPLSGVAQISAGYNDTCAVTNAGASSAGARIKAARWATAPTSKSIVRYRF